MGGGHSMEAELALYGVHYLQVHACELVNLLLLLVLDVDSGGILSFLTRDQFSRVPAVDVDGGASGMRVPGRSSFSVEFDSLENAD